MAQKLVEREADDEDRNEQHPHARSMSDATSHANHRAAVGGAVGALASRSLLRHIIAQEPIW